MSKLLFDESPLVVQPTLAKAIGLNEAIILQQINYWMNQRAGKIIAGQRWIYNSIAKWQEQFPFWSAATIDRTIDNLVWAGLVKTGNYNKSKRDRTKWYTIDFAIIDLLDALIEQEQSMKNAIGQVDQLEDSNLPNCNQSECSNIPETTSETTSNTIFSSPSDECDFDSIPSASGKEVQKQEEPARMTADEYKTRVRAAMSNSGNKKRAVAEGKSAVDEDEVQVARILASVKDQQVLPSDLFRDKKNATAIIYRRAAKALIHEMKMMGRTLEDVKKTGDYFLNGGGERYRAPNVNYAAGTIAAHFAEHWRSETKKPTVVPAPIQKLKVPDYAR